MKRGQFDLWPLQEKAIHDLRCGYADGHLRQVLQLATGLGKTHVAAAMAATALEKGRKVGFVAPLISLIDQTLKVFEKHDLRCGVIQGTHEQWNPAAPVQICSIQTLGRRKFPELDFWIIDEIHILHKTHISLLEKFKTCPIIGLSATPWRAGLGKYFTNLVRGPSMEDAIADGRLVPWECWAPSAPDLSRVSKLAGDWNQKELAIASRKTHLIADIVETWKKHGQNRQTLCYATSIEHSKDIVDAFRSEGIQFVHIDAYDDTTTCFEAIKGFETGRYVGISSVGKLTTGFNAPYASCIIMARATRSQMLFHQMIGRGIRADEGKTNCIILDHSGNMVDADLNQPVPTSLCNGFVFKQKKFTKKEPVRKACPSCKHLKELKEYTCSKCGYVPQKQSTVVHVSGDLVKIDSTTRMVSRAAEKRNREMSWDEKLIWYGALKWHSRYHGYSDGWIAHKYRALTSVWPNDPRLKQAKMIEPTGEIADWIRGQQIRWAHRK